MANEERQGETAFELIQAQTRPDQQPTPYPLVHSQFQLRSVVNDFTGRDDEIRRMVERLRGEGGSIGVSALRGMGGIGKTTLARKVAHEVASDFPDALIELNLQAMSEVSLTPAAAMSEIIHAFHPGEKLPDSQSALVARYLTVLRGKRALILLDNAKDEEQVQHLVTAPPPVGFIITSRKTLALDGVESIKLDVLPANEALKLLRLIVGVKGTDDELAAVGELCGWLPLALRVAGDFLLLHENWSVQRYIDSLHNESRRLERLKGNTKDKDVKAVLGFGAAELSRSNPEQAVRWQLLSVFPADFDPIAVANVWDLNNGDKPDPDATVDELTGLLDWSLVQYDEKTDRYSLHDLMRPVARDAFKYLDNHGGRASSADRMRTAELRFAWHYLSILVIASHWYEKGDDKVLRGLALFDVEEDNIRHGWQWVADNQIGNDFVAKLSQDYTRVTSLIHLRLSDRELLEWLEPGIEAHRHLGDRAGERRCLEAMGQAYVNLGDMRTAITFYEQSLAIAHEIGNRRGEGDCLGNIGRAYVNLGDARTAITFYEQSLAIAHEIGNRVGEGLHCWDMADALVALGQHRDAVPFAERALEYFESIGHTCVEPMREMLAGWRAIETQPKAALNEAITVHEQSLATALVLGDRRGEADCCWKIGRAYSELGDVRTAITFYEQSLAIAHEIGNRRVEADCLMNMGCAYSELGDVRTAITFYEQSLAIAREIGNRRGEGDCLGNMGYAYSDLGDARTAITFYEQSLAIAHEIGNRVGEGLHCWDMADALVALGQHRDAVPFAERALEYFESIGHTCVEPMRETLAGWRDIETQPNAAQNNSEVINSLAPTEQVAVASLDQGNFASVASDRRSGPWHMDRTTDEQICTWFESIKLSACLRHLQVFWCIGIVECEAFQAAGRALGYGKLQVELSDLDPHFNLTPLPRSITYIRETCLPELAAIFNSTPFQPAAWTEEEGVRDLRVEDMAGARTHGRWTPRARKAWCYIDRFLTIRELRPTITVA